MKFKNWITLTKVTAASVCILITLVITEFLIKNQFDDMEEQVRNQLAGSAVSGLESMTKLNYQIPLMRVHIYRYSFFTDPEHRKNIEYLLKETYAKVLSGLEEYKLSSFDTKKQKSAQELSNLVEQYWLWVQKTIDVVDSGVDAHAIQQVMNDYTPLYVQIEKQMESMVAKNVKYVDLSVESVELSMDNSRFYLQLAILFTVVICILLLIFLRV